MVNWINSVYFHFVREALSGKTTGFCLPQLVYLHVLNTSRYLCEAAALTAKVKS